MKFFVLLLLCCCAVAIAKPADSHEATDAPKQGSKEDSHLVSGGDSKGGSKESNESNESNGDSNDDSNGDSSNESDRKDDGGGLTTSLPGQITISQPSTQQLEKLLDHVVDVTASLFGQRGIHSVRDLIARIKSNPIGNITWNLVILPFLRNVSYFPDAILTQIQAAAAQIFPLIDYFPPFTLAKSIIQFVFSILSNIAKIFIQ